MLAAQPKHKISGAKIIKKYLVVNKYQNENIRKIDGLDLIGYIRYNKNVSENVDANNSEINNDIHELLLKSGIL